MKAVREAVLRPALRADERIGGIPLPVRVGRAPLGFLQRLLRIVRLEDGGILQDIPVPATLADEDRLLRAHPCER